MRFGIYLVRCGALTAEDFVDAVESQLSERTPLGTLAIEERKLTMKQLFAVLEAQAVSPQPFGQLAIELGFLTNSDVLQLVGLQSERCRPMAEHLVELGLIDAEELRTQLQQFHAMCHSQRPDDDDEDAVEVDGRKHGQRSVKAAPPRERRPAVKRPGADKNDVRRKPPR